MQSYNTLLADPAAELPGLCDKTSPMPSQKYP